MKIKAKKMLQKKKKKKERNAHKPRSKVSSMKWTIYVSLDFLSSLAKIVVLINIATL